MLHHGEDLSSELSNIRTIFYVHYFCLSFEEMLFLNEVYMIVYILHREMLKYLHRNNYHEKFEGMK